MASRKVTDFISALAPQAAAIGAQYGIDPKVIIGQAALETGWGSSVAGNNYFGIKGKGQNVATHEDYGNGLVPVTQSFRTYNGLADSMADYGRLIGTTKRYAPALNEKDPYKQAEAIWKAGYASDRDYMTKMTGVMNMIPDDMVYGVSLGYAPNTGIRTPALDAIGQATAGVRSTGNTASTPLDVQMATNPAQALRNYGVAPFVQNMSPTPPMPDPRAQAEATPGLMSPSKRLTEDKGGLLASLVGGLTGGINNAKVALNDAVTNGANAIGVEAQKTAANVNPMDVISNMPGGLLGNIGKFVNFGNLGGFMGKMNPLPVWGEAARVAAGGSPNHPAGTVISTNPGNGGITIQGRNGPLNSIAQQHLRAQHGSGEYSLATDSGGWAGGRSTMES